MQKKQRTRSGSAGMIAFLIMALASALLFTLSGNQTEVLMLGDEEMTVECGSEFVDPGVEIVRTGKLFKFMNETELVPAVEHMTTDTLGKFKLHYIVASNGQELQFERIVNVVDTTPPSITVSYPDGSTGGSWMNGGSEPHIQALDLADGDLSDQVLITHLPDGKVIYSVSDSQGNEGVFETMPPSSFQAPEIVLTGGSDYTCPAALSWSDPGYTVTDSDGRDLSESVQVSGRVVSYQPGDYALSYQLTNSRGDTVTAERTVHVVPAEHKEAVIPEQKTIYLTFDDGPGPYTDQLLDVLAKYNVKATFFVTGQYPDYYDCIRRAYDEGHTIGVHTYTHDYNKVYASILSYLEDFQNCEDLIYEYTGSYTTIFRFPGGASNEISDFNPGIMSALVPCMRDMGYYQFDWNVSSGDATAEEILTYDVYQNVINGCAKFDTSVVLQHDVKGYSVNAVESIIRWGLDNGYQFLPLQEDSYGAWHKVFN